MIINTVFLTSICNELGGDWGIVPIPVNNDWQKHPDRIKSGEKEIRFSTDSRAAMKGKVRIVGIFPFGYRGESVSINVSFERGAAAIAKEINKRFMPEYEKKLIEAKEEADKRNAYERELTKTKEVVGGAMGSNSRHDQAFYHTVNGVYIRARVDSPESVRFELNLNRNQAKNLIEAIKKGSI